MKECLFCKIIQNEVSSYKIYEDDKNIAVLDIYPAVRGQSLVMPKKHFGSYVFDMNNDEYLSLMIAAKNVAHLTDEKLGSKRTCMVMEGMEIDHAHIKLYPIHKVITRIAKGTINLNKYKGFISTLHGKRMHNSELECILEKFK
jgi:diadenosine tetraphosphate (Ap4A) HIT family hydrolase